MEELLCSKICHWVCSFFCPSLLFSSSFYSQFSPKLFSFASLESFTPIDFENIDEASLWFLRNTKKTLYTLFYEYLENNLAFVIQLRLYFWILYFCIALIKFPTYKLSIYQDKGLRELATQALSALAKYDLGYFGNAVLERLIPCTLSSDLCMRHGATLAAGELVLALHQSGFVLSVG